MGPYGPIWAHIWAHKGPNPDPAPVETPICRGPEPGPHGSIRAHMVPCWVQKNRVLTQHLLIDSLAAPDKPPCRKRHIAGPSPGWGPVRVGARSGLGPIWALMGPYMGPYGPIWAHVGPYGPIWALMGPYGPSWTGLGGLGRFRQISVTLLDKFRTFRVQKWYFDTISR